MTHRLLDRRRHPRLEPGEHRIISARVRPGHRATVIDLSEGGALIEIAKGLLPGAMVDVHFSTSLRQTAVRGQVIRCAVSALHPGAVLYRAAIAFEYPIPASERAAAHHDRVGASRNGR